MYPLMQKLLQPVLLVVLANSLALPGSAQTTESAKSAGPNEPKLKLDPFVVREDDNVGYSATSTLSGTRLNTALRDVGAAVSIITPEYMSDIGATDAQKLLTFTLGTEVGGSGGNFAGGAAGASGRADQSDARENPQNNQRVRGIGPASNTRDYFLTDIAFDAYNTSRVTINRGPNALLFGIGNPSGVIEASTIKTLLDKNRTT